MRWPFLSIFSRKSSKPKRVALRPSRTRPRFQPGFELLEDRVVPALQTLLQQTGFADLLINDNGAGDSDPTAGAITFIGTYGTFDLTVTSAISKPLLGNPTMAV